jgi:hypothetical protein
VNDDTQENRQRGRYFRYAVFALAALLVLSLGFVLIPREPPAPPTPPFSEQARASAYSDALTLRSAGLALASAAGDAPAGPQAVSLGSAVTLLTVHARALTLAGDPAAPRSPGPGSPASAAEFAAALQTSAARRLKDAETADGGMARLLAGAGTAQLLAAEDVAEAAGLPLPALTGPELPGTSDSPTAQESLARPTDSPTRQESPAGPAASATASCPAEPTGASPGSALARAVAAELELVYAYQAALTRLDAASAAPAAGFLAQHQELHDNAEAMIRSTCTAAAPQPAGYALTEAFLAAPATTLGTLEAGTLPAYGDLVALGEGSTRVWALSALQAAARRALHWGGSLSPVPGMVLAEAELPQLAEAAVDDPHPEPSPTGKRS